MSRMCVPGTVVNDRRELRMVYVFVLSEGLILLRAQRQIAVQGI